MITVPEDVFRVLLDGKAEKRVRVTWTLNNSQILVFRHGPEERLVSVGSVARTIAPFLGCYRVSNVSVSLANDDDYFSPNVAGSLLNTQKRKDWLDSTMKVEQEVYGPVTGWHAIPVYTGYVQDMNLGGGVADFTVVDRLARQLTVEIPEALQFDNSTVTSPAALIENYLTDYTTLTTAELHTASFTYAKDTQDDMEWVCQGFTPVGEILGRLVVRLARSSMCQIYPQEDGLIRLESEWPVDWGNGHHAVQVFPVTFDDDNVDLHALRFDARTCYAAFAVKHQGITVEYRNATKETDLGYGAGEAPVYTVDMPYLLSGAQAAWAANFLYETQDDYLDIVQVSSPDIGLLVQLGDRVKVNTRRDDSAITYRVHSKRWSPAGVEVEAVREHHYTDIIDADLALEGTTAWGGASKAL